MSEITKPIMLNETGQLIADGIARQNLLLAELVASSGQATPVSTLNEIASIVRAGNAENVFDIGDQIMLNYNDGSHDYVLPWDIVHFGNVQLGDGETVPGMYIQSHYAMQAVMFDQNEAFYVVPASGLAAGTYYITMGNSWGSNVVSGKSYYFTLASSYSEGDLLQFGTASDEIGALPDKAPSAWRVKTYKASGSTPAGLAASPTETLTVTEGTSGTSLGTLSSSTKYGTSGVNNMQRASYGYNRWSQSAMRQFLNSDAAVGAWWTPQNPYDRRPTQLGSIRGFMAGFDDAFLNIIKPVKVTTALNTVSDSEIGTTEDTYDTFFPASLEQEYCVPQLSGVEGDYWMYWRRRLGLTSPQASGTANLNTRHIRYAYEAQTSAQTCRLRSASRGTANNPWNVTSTGYVHNGYAATGSIRCAPACVIC